MFSERKACVVIFESLALNKSVITTLDTNRNFKTHNTGKYRGIFALMEHCHIISSKLCSYAQLLLLIKPRLQICNQQTTTIAIYSKGEVCVMINESLSSNISVITTMNTKNQWPGISLSMRPTKLVIRHSFRLSYMNKVTEFCSRRLLYIHID